MRTLGASTSETSSVGTSLRRHNPFNCEQQRRCVAPAPADQLPQCLKLLLRTVMSTFRLQRLTIPLGDAAPAPVVACTWPAPVGYAAPAPVGEKISRAPAAHAVYGASAPVLENIAPASTVSFAAPAPVIEYMALAWYGAPAPVVKNVALAPIVGAVPVSVVNDISWRRVPLVQRLR